MMMAIKESNEYSLDNQFAKLRELRDELEKDLNFKFVSVINENTREIGILFNFEFIENILKNIDDNIKALI